MEQSLRGISKWARAQAAEHDITQLVPAKTGKLQGIKTFVFVKQFAFLSCIFLPSIDSKIATWPT